MMSKQQTQPKTPSPEEQKAAIKTQRSLSAAEKQKPYTQKVKRVLSAPAFGDCTHCGRKATVATDHICEIDYKVLQTATGKKRVQIIKRDEKTGNPIINNRKRCIKCGFVEGEK